MKECERGRVRAAALCVSAVVMTFNVQSGNIQSGGALNPAGVEQVAQQFKGTHDIAGAAEALVRTAGKQFVYSYGTMEGKGKEFTAIGSPQDVYNHQQLICYEFVHYTAFLAGNQAYINGETPKMGSAAGNVYQSNKSTVWDGKSEIPRNKIIVFKAYAFNNTSGYYHVGISLGDGKIAHNSSSGNVQISKLSDVNSLGYSEVRYADYDWLHTQGDSYQPGQTAAPGQTGAAGQGGQKGAGGQVGPTGAETRGDAASQTGAATPNGPPLDILPLDFRFAPYSSCCGGEPLGVPLPFDTGLATSGFQTFVTGRPVDLSFLNGQLVTTLGGKVGSDKVPPGPLPTLRIVATGASTGQAFTLQIHAPTGTTGRLWAPDGLVLVPLSAIPVTDKSDPRWLSSPLTAFCADFNKETPPAGMTYGVMQDARAGFMQFVVRGGVLAAARGELHPDGDLPAYSNFITQYSVWTSIEHWQYGQFQAAFLSRTRKNVESMKVRWTPAMEEGVRAAAPNRWRDIQTVIKDARNLEGH